MDKSSQVPLPNSNVCLDPTHIGCATTQDGSFQLKNVPEGDYELIASHVGYGPESLRVHLKVGEELHLLILLSEEPVPLRGLLVEARRPIGDAVASKKTIRREDMRTHAGGFSSDMFRYIQNLPGVVRGLSEQSGVFVVRGGDPDENLILFSGIELLHPFHFQGFTSVVPSDLVERVAFYPSSFPVEFGNALSSVTTITPKVAEKREGFWRYDVANMGAGYMGSTLKNLYLMISLRRTFYRVKFGPLAVKKDLHPQYYDAVGRLVWSAHPSHVLSFCWLRGVDVYRTTKDELSSNLSESGNLYSSSWCFSPLGKLRLESSLYKTDYALTGIWLENPSAEIHLSKVYEEKGFKETGFFSPASWLELSFGGEIGNAIYSREKSRKEADFLGGYLELALSPLPLISLSLGARYDHIRWVGKRAISPGAATKLRLSDRVSLRAGYRVAEQHPFRFFKNPYYSFYEQEDMWPALSQELEPKKAIHYALGTDLQLDPSSVLRLDVYRKDYSNLLTWECDPGGQDKRYSNSGYGHAKGAELSIERKEQRGLHGWVSYAFSVCRKREGEINQLLPGDYDQRHLLNLCLRLPSRENWLFSTTFRYGTGKPYTPTKIMEDGEVVLGDRNSRRLPSYHRLDVRLEKGFPDKPLKPYLYVEVLNLYNRENIFRWVDYEYQEGAFVNVASTGLPFTPLAGIGGYF